MHLTASSIALLARGLTNSKRGGKVGKPAEIEGIQSHPAWHAASKVPDSCPGRACCPFSVGCPQSRISHAFPPCLGKVVLAQGFGVILLTPEMSADIARTAQGCAHVPQAAFLLPPCFNQSQISSSQLLWLLECKLPPLPRP